MVYSTLLSLQNPKVHLSCKQQAKKQTTSSDPLAWHITRERCNSSFYAFYKVFVTKHLGGLTSHSLDWVAKPRANSSRCHKKKFASGAMPRSSQIT